MVDNANTSSGTKCHSEAKALVPTAGLSDLNPAGRSMASPVTNSAEANQRRRFAHSTEKKRHPKKRATSSFDAIAMNQPIHRLHQRCRFHTRDHSLERGC